MTKHRLNTVKHRLLVEKDRGNTCRKNQEKKTSRFFWRIFLEVSIFTALAVDMDKDSERDRDRDRDKEGLGQRQEPKFLNILK
jgi:hypothetical protein